MYAYAVCHPAVDASAQVRLNHAVTADELKSGGFDDIILATGVAARTPAIEGVKHPKVCAGIDVYNVVIMFDRCFHTLM
jgi:hypothetical protein